jgi:hypothetical protein
MERFIMQYEKFIKIKVGHNVNFRSQPVVDPHNVIGTCLAGEILQVFQVEGTWGYAKRESNGQVGFVTMKDEYVEDYVPEWLAQGKSLVEDMEKYMLDTNPHPYVFGSSRTNDRDFDCSDLMQWEFDKVLGIEIPWDSRKQSGAGVGIGTGYDVLRTGDLIFFDTNNDGIINHVAMYVYPNKIIHTYSTKSDTYNRDFVKIKSGQGGITYSRYEDGTSWRNNTTGARRITK